MLLPFKDRLANIKIILGSQSPRRRELLSPIVNFEVVVTNFDESKIHPEDFPSPKEFVREQAKCKCEFLTTRITDADIIITADTVVFIDNTIFGKPKSHEEAYEMINKLNGRVHFVETGVFIWFKSRSGEIRTSSFSEETKIYFDDLSDEVMRLYADSEDPLDKSGGYGYGAFALSLVKKIEGDFGNSIGLPVNSIAKKLYEFLEQDEKL